MIGKRNAIISAVLIMIACAVPAVQWAGQRAPQQQPQPQPRQIPTPSFPANSDPGGIRGGGPFDEPPSPKINPRAQLNEAQKKLSADVEHLLQLATELKDESDKTKEADVLSLPLIHKAEEIEKLAKQIKDLARAN